MSAVLETSMELPLCGVKLGEVKVDGSPIVIRGACRSDRSRILEFLESLDTETVYERFHHVVSDFRSYVDSLMESGALIVVAEIEGKVIGMAEAVACRRDYVEIGLVVSRGYRGRGVGTALCTSLAEACKRLGFKGLIAYVKRYNIPVLRIARKLGASVKPSEEPDTVLVEACFEN